MSERLLTGACDDCPLRKKLDCNSAELVKKQVYAKSEGTTWSKTTSDRLVYAFSDEPEGDGRIIELQPVEADAYLDHAEKAAEVTAEEKSRLRVSKDGAIAQIIRQEAIGLAASRSRSEDLNRSLEDSFHECDNPITDETSFLRRKKCGANVLARAIPTGDVRYRKQVDAALKKTGYVWYSPERQRRFKPIR